MIETQDKSKIITLEDLESTLREEGIQGTRKRNYFYDCFFTVDYKFKDDTGALTFIFALGEEKLKELHSYSSEKRVKNAGGLRVSGASRDLNMGAYAYTSVPFPFNYGYKTYNEGTAEMLRKTLCKNNKLQIRDGGSIAPKSMYITRDFHIIHGDKATPQDI